MSLHLNIRRFSVLTTAALGAFASAGQAVMIEELLVTSTPLQFEDGLPPEKIPANVQSLDTVDVDDSQALGLADMLNTALGSVHLNAAQGNPLQPDLQYRGAAASPLLGLPQGLSVYQNGVRINEPLGDAVNWDLLPETAIHRIQLRGGSDPVFGLNTLGGALSVEMKNGFNFQGHAAEATAGSFGRRLGSIESGANDGRFGYYVNGYYFEEEGWRDLSDSDLHSFYGALNWRGARGDLELSHQFGDSFLTGNGAVPEGLLDLDREAIFTAPDETENQLHQTILRGSYDINDSVRVDGVGFYRRNRTRSFNGDGSEFEECVVDGLEVLIEGLEEDELDAAGLDCAAGITTAMLDAAGGEVAENVEGNPIAAEFEDPLTGEDHERDAINNISRRTQTSWGGDLQTTFDGELSGRDNRLVVGGGIFRGEADFDSDTEVSFLNPVTRSTNNSPDSGEFVEEARTRVNTETHTVSLYFTDTLSLTNAIAVTLAGRYNRTRIKIRDRSGDRPELNGNHTFSRFNPAVGLTWQARDQHNLYASYNESSRAPTPIELSCNDEIAELAELLSGDDDFECRLPNAFLADPPLDQVVAKTIEAGVRGELGAINYHVGLFRTEHHDDIIFQSTGRATGLFKNVDETRRQGMETRLSGRVGNLTWYGAYTFLKATYESDFEALSPNHAGADAEGLINVRAGDRLPGIPKHLFKLGGDYRHSDWALGAELLHNSSQFLRGDESNQLDRVDGHTVVNLRTSYRINKNISIRARVNNVFDTDYETFGIVGEDPDEVVGLGGIDDSPLFFGPAPGRAAFVTVKAEFD